MIEMNMGSNNEPVYSHTEPLRSCKTRASQSSLAQSSGTYRGSPRFCLARGFKKGKHIVPGIDWDFFKTVEVPLKTEDAYYPFLVKNMHQVHCRDSASGSRTVSALYFTFDIRRVISDWLKMTTANGKGRQGT